MQVPVDEVVDVIAVRHRGVAAHHSMDVRAVMRATGVRRRAASGVHSIDLDRALVDVAIVSMVEVAIV